MSNFQPFKVTAIQKESTLSLMSPQRLSEKVQLKNKRLPKIQNCNFGQTRYMCFSITLEVSSQKIKRCCNNNSYEESTFQLFTLHGHKTD